MKPDQIARLLAQAIREGLYAPGSSLIQEDLASRFRVSRSPIREALRMLSAEGLIIMPPGGQGATVRTLTRDELIEIYDLRLLIEPSLAKPIVARGTAAEVDALRRLDDQMAAATEVSAWMRLNFSFHELMYEMAGRPHTSGMVANLLSLSQPYSRHNIDKLGGREQATSEHALMVAAIETRDADELARLITDHLNHARTRLLDSLPPAEESDPLAILRG
ncbi:DNA-binding GntR family transcriptional regulator [Microbacterium sp. AG1240]|uniref:GntR family transcriptional regulator n=1 Tax=Microbacterium sp. AG1240 TaxID=2183992 RepID=UPI000EB1A462|nr:GntR family transcriptional regulator [Microbacterium sp. AG1240]RKT36082.1 DNA-binding GntR family transcriptional regulator [Microbacterium sp. AG1240]